jgi:hypothetical protein
MDDTNVDNKRCCDNGNFGDEHQCCKEPGEEPGEHFELSRWVKFKFRFWLAFYITRAFFRGITFTHVIALSLVLLFTTFLMAFLVSLNGLWIYVVVNKLFGQSLSLMDSMFVGVAAMAMWTLRWTRKAKK